MTLKTMVIVNPKSGGGSTGRHWTAIRPALEAVLDRYEEEFTRAPGDATELARRAIGEGFEQLVVIGGDGTFNEVVEGVFEPDSDMGIGRRLLRPDLVLAPVRRGTGGDFARYLQLPGKGSRIFEHLGSERLIDLDLGLATFLDHGGRPRRRAFANVASFGLTGLVDEKVNASGKKYGSASFLGSIVSALLEYEKVPLRVVVDGEPLYEGPVVLGAVGNGAYFGGGVRIAPDAALDDGLFEVVLLLERGPREIVRALDLYSGRHVRWSSARVGRGRVIEAEPIDRRRCLLDLDGEQPGVLGARFEVVPRAARLRVPGPAHRA